MKKRSLKCYGFCCHDRYSCQLYTLEAEPKDGSVYPIPDDHVPGDEHCELYIPFDKEAESKP